MTDLTQFYIKRITMKNGSMFPYKVRPILQIIEIGSTRVIEVEDGEKVRQTDMVLSDGIYYIPGKLICAGKKRLHQSLQMFQVIKIDGVRFRSNRSKCIDFSYCEVLGSPEYYVGGNIILEHHSRTESQYPRCSRASNIISSVNSG